MRLAFMGTPAFALPTLAGLLAAPQHELVLVITQPDKPVGRGRKLQAPPVKLLAEEHGVPVVQPARLKDNPAIRATLEDSAPDAVVVVAYGKIIPAAMLTIPRYGFINVHASLLPAYRGAAPINRALLDGCLTTGVSIMQIDEGLDSGPVYVHSELDIEPQDDAVSLARRLADLGARELVQVLEGLERDTPPTMPQDHAKATYAPMLKKDDGLIDWTRDPDSLHNQIRGLIPWPGAFTRLQGRLLRILKAEPVTAAHTHRPGTLVRAEPGVKIACTGGYIIPLLLQMEGKKAVDGRAFANGLHAVQIQLGE